MKSQALRMLDRYEEALTAVEKAIELDPEDELANGTKGEVLRMLGRYEQALDALNRAIEFNPDNNWALELKKEIQSFSR